MDFNLTFEEYKENFKEGLCTEGGNCPVCTALASLQGKWKMSIIFQIAKNGDMRFSEIKKALGNITNTALSNALKSLEKDEIIVRKQYNEIPPHVEYSLTEKGDDLLPVFYAITVWGMKYML